eukprot:1142069-Pelagomonas_calceolata.AAC.1
MGKNEIMAEAGFLGPIWPPWCHPGACAQAVGKGTALLQRAKQKAAGAQCYVPAIPVPVSVLLVTGLQIHEARNVNWRKAGS